MSLSKNSLIEDQTEATLINVQSILYLVKEVHSKLALLDEYTSPSLHLALSTALKCAEDAVVYEIDKLEGDQLSESETITFGA